MKFILSVPIILIVIVTVFPFVSHGLGRKVLADFVVDVGFVGLAELVAAADLVRFPVLDEMGAGLVEAEGDAACNALFADG